MCSVTQTNSPLGIRIPVRKRTWTTAKGEKWLAGPEWIGGDESV
jgi:hypothetical protein